MKKHFSTYWIHYFVLAIIVFFIVKLYSDSKGSGFNKSLSNELDYNKILTTGTSSKEVEAAQAYINDNLDNSQIQGNPLAEDGVLGANSTLFFELVKFCPVGEGTFNNGTGFVSTTLTEIINLTNSYNCG